jgi:hypothetical protein
MYLKFEIPIVLYFFCVKLIKIIFYQARSAYNIRHKEKGASRIAIIARGCTVIFLILH